MKKQTFVLILVIGLFGAIGFLWPENVWTGYAAVGTNKDFTKYSDGYRATSNTFPAGTLLRVSNPKTGKNVEVEIVGRLNTPGVLILIEEAGATSIGLPHDRVMPVRVAPIVSRTRMQALTPAVTYEESMSESYADSYLRDPDYNPAETFDNLPTPEEPLTSLVPNDNLSKEILPADDTKAAENIENTEKESEIETNPLIVDTEPVITEPETTINEMLTEDDIVDTEPETTINEMLTEDDIVDTEPETTISEMLTEDDIVDTEPDLTEPETAISEMLTKDDIESYGVEEKAPPVETEELTNAPTSADSSSDLLTRLDNIPGITPPVSKKEIFAYHDVEKDNKLDGELAEYPVSENNEALEGELAEFIETIDNPVMVHSEEPGINNPTNLSPEIISAPLSNTVLPEDDTYTPSHFLPDTETDLSHEPENGLIDNEDEDLSEKLVLDNNDNYKNVPADEKVEDDLSRWLNDISPSEEKKNDFTELADEKPLTTSDNILKKPGEIIWPDDTTAPGKEIVKDDEEIDKNPNSTEDFVNMDVRTPPTTMDTVKPQTDVVYFLTPADLRPPESLESVDNTKTKPLPLESSFAKETNNEKKENEVTENLVNETNKKINTDERSILDLSNIKQLKPGSHDSYIQVGYFSTPEELINEARILKEKYPLPSHVELSYDKRKKFYLLIGPVRPAEKGVVLKNIRAGVVPDAFIYSPK